MTREYHVAVEGQIDTVVVSDDREALLAAKAAGKASVELWGKSGNGLFLTRYAAESLEEIDEEYLEQVARRNRGLPWKILGTRRLMIREFQPGDERLVPKEPEDGEADKVFRDRRLLEEYIRCQYGFYGYGIWAVTDRQSGRIVGKAGVTNLRWETEKGEALELGYHIFSPYRRQGYAKEACEGILGWCEEHFPGYPVYAKTDSSNEKSVMLLRKLGFDLTDQRCSGSGQIQFLFRRNCL